MGKQNGICIEPLEARRLFTSGPLLTLPESVFVDQPNVIGDTLYFTNLDQVTNVWRSDGTAGGTRQIQDPVAPYALGFDAGAKVFTAPLGDKLIGYGDIPGAEFSLGALVYAIDNATEKATVLVRLDTNRTGDIPLGIAIGNVAYFYAMRKGNPGIWRTDGTVAGTTVVKHIYSSNDLQREWDIPRSFTAVGNRFFFHADKFSTGDELWVSDGTADGTQLVSDLTPTKDKNGAGLDSSPQDLTAVGNRLAFHTTPGDGVNATSKLWITDGTANGTLLLKQATNFSAMTAAADGKTFYFVSYTDDAAQTRSLWKSDGTTTVRLFDALGGTDISDLHVSGGKLYFTYTALTGAMEMVSDGTAGGTVAGRAPFQLDLPSLNWPVPMGSSGKFVFTGPQGFDRSAGLYVTDGTSLGTRQLAANDAQEGFAIARSKIYFFGPDPTGGPMTMGGSTTISAWDPAMGNIAGNVFDDLDGDGVRDPGEKGLTGYKVFIDRNGDGICNKKEAWTRASWTGRFAFNLLLPPADYVIRVVGVEGRIASTPERYRVHVTADGTVTRNFGRTVPALVAGLVYMDANKNGTIDAGESGMGGWTVFVDADDDGLLDADERSALTNAGGRFAIAAPAGTWRVRALPQARYRQTSPGAGYRAVTVAAGAVSAKLNFGEKRLK